MSESTPAGTAPGGGRTREPGRPVILTVDDDASVSRAVARDLRRRYAEDYRIMRAESGDDALAAIREVVLRGDEVALLLADHRMPRMTGVEFLERAMDLVPRARRALLTAYADTDAAIAAINVVDIDHYLLKPWEPPEEKLYPVVDDMLADWQARGREPVRQVVLVGHRWSAPSHEVRDFLARNLVPYRWVSVEDEEGRRLVAAAGADEGTVPLVVTVDGEALVRPTLPELADRVGLTTTATEDFYDVVVVGAGPAGLGAAVYAASEGLRTLVVERSAAGGQAGQSSRIENYLGFPDGVTGGQLTDRARRQAQRLGAEMVTARAVTSLESSGQAHRVGFEDGTAVTCHAVVLASGVSYRELVATGVSDLVGRGVYYGSAATQAQACQDDHVVIVGGANSAGQAAVFFARNAAKVTIAVRGPSLAASMSAYLIEQIEAADNIEVRTGTTVEDCGGNEHLECLTLRSTDGTTEVVDAGHLFIFIGAAPATDWLPPTVQRDPAGFVLTGPELPAVEELPGWPLEREPYLLEASVPGVFVAGDVRAQSVKRVASAVGEGALAVTLVHRYLATR